MQVNPYYAPAARKFRASKKVKSFLVLLFKKNTLYQRR